eukprot:CAMPEP_0117555770 /NCGR_PEP_ID=MMETSP0784-20121206/51449_1 /TAXON_ID=39447 /ORGANISM="" /LENGTH=58 /DNA_ID=CAMNT_0005352993 /DNA_START=124 /DNA_END=296 /DNA_ORIENTATION=+
MCMLRLSNRKNGMVMPCTACKASAPNDSTWGMEAFHANQVRARTIQSQSWSEDAAHPL